MANDRCFLHKSTSARYRSERRKSGGRANKRGLNTKVHMAIDAFGMPVRLIVTSGTIADSSQVCGLIKRNRS